MQDHLAGRGRERQGGALRRRDGGLSLQVPQPPPRPPAREVPAQHEAGHLRVGAQGRGHPLHTSVARNRQRGQVQRQAMQLVFEGIVLYLVQERRQSVRAENVFSKSEAGNIFSVFSSVPKVPQERLE